MDIKGEINTKTVIVEDFNTPLTSRDRSSRQKINKEMAALNNALDQTDLIDIFRAFHPKVAEYTCFSSAHKIFSRIKHMLEHKRSLNKLRRLKSYQAYSDYNAMKLVINHKNKTENT